ncbi:MULTISPECIES: transcriptional regulator GcvA [Raoultella]|uniref:Gcv operon activator n=1 Tax=Raoultella planticola TaxID=575 RepID=A0A485CGL4_RAOPL|nr:MULTISPECIES: transcriptional regulator GcvA [Raoultella]MDU4421654.1 transcriptional regulator GcvA [Raoultella sp.]ELT9607187.1 transcriptional regulator GcvA [Raoultella planticola]KFD05000.1 glycine cleavage system transcriptional activator [Raoultella planticola ATCC 33531]OZP73950.1 transcriptional regulator GcvA [Raoultella planticola]TJZ64903.1 transcriptional regulator GcvA [Raoultella planticola]
MKLPPLHALMCFESAARHLSMKKAAEELCVTASAVSQQIAKLEGMIHIRLFIRSPRSLELTDEARIYLRAIRPAFSQIAEATQRLMNEGKSNKITISCTSGFAIQWLLPRLPEFEKENPGVEVQISTTNRRVDLLSEGIDFAVRHGTGYYPGLESECLLNDRLRPVCSPSLVPQEQPLSSPFDITRYTLLHDEHRMDWALWFNAVGIAGADTDKGPVFVDSNGVLEAALAGKGIALIRDELIREELKNGTLINPLRMAIDSPIAYYLVYHESATLQRISRRFRDWLSATAAANKNEYPT